MLVPKVTVLMPVYNGEKYLKEAIESILSQTFTDFEFLIINDGSTDKSLNILNEYACCDKRIVLISRENKGLVKTLNEGITISKGKYIARMDCDDISFRTRLEHQVRFMDNNPSVGLLGCWIEKFGNGKRRIFRLPIENDKIKCNLLFDSVFAHPSVIFRREFLIKNSLFYNDEYKHSEDYKLWHDCCKYFDVANIPIILLKYRLVSTSVSHIFKNEQINSKLKTQKDALSSLGIMNSNYNDESMNCAMNGNLTQDFKVIEDAEKLLLMIKDINDIKMIYSDKELNITLTKQLFHLCKSNAHFMNKVIVFLFKSRLFNVYNIGGINILKFLMKCTFYMFVNFKRKRINKFDSSATPSND